jgi:hypothetical protein
MRMSHEPMRANEFTTFLGASLYALRHGGKVNQTGYWRWEVV